MTYGEDALDDEVVELLEGGLVRLGERGGELLGGVGLRGLQGLAGEGEPAEEPHEALGRGALLLGLLVLDEQLERRRRRGPRVIPGAHFLRAERRRGKGRAQPGTGVVSAGPACVRLTVTGSP